jgi:hypothetical protein
MSSDTQVRELLARALGWKDAHGGFDGAIEGLDPGLRGRQPEGLPYSPWQLVEHIRITQYDILDFCRNPKYEERRWPEDYWPSSVAPPSTKAWEESIEQYRKDRDELRKLALDPKVALDARIPHGTGQTYRRELVLVIDHTAYHVGQLVVVRRLLGAWK